MKIRSVITALLLIICLAASDVAVFAADGEGTGEAVNEQPEATLQVQQPTQTFSVQSSAAKATEATDPTQATQPTQVKKLPVVTRFNLSGWDTTFKNKVNRNDYLPANTVPYAFKLTAKRKSMKIFWKRPSNLGAIDGYILLRKTGKSNRYHELKRLPKKTTSYIDKKARKKNTKYAYMIVPYKKGSIIRISQNASPWLVGYTTKTKKKNLYSTKITNKSSIAKVNIGSTAKANAKVPKKTVHKYLRWYSSNTRVATIDNNGYIKGIAAGTVTITVRTATGRTTSTTVKVVKPSPKPKMLEVMRSWVGIKSKNNGHKKIIDLYNSYKPLPRGYKMKYSDAWCDATISAAAIASGNVDAVGRECGVPSHITIFKNKKIWIEDGTITPRPGDIVVFAWSKSKQPNNASGSHIGIVESVSKGQITTIEGNCSNMVKRRTMKVGWGYIRGYARPNYVN